MTGLANLVRWSVILAVTWLSGAPTPARSASGSPSSATATLSYVESSVGLIPPSLEGGRTEIEMGDVDADGNIDLVSIGDHGSPYVNTDEHGIMVWFGSGDGNWSVYQNGEFGYGGVALGDVNGDGDLDVAYAMHHDYSGVDFGNQLIEAALGDGTGQNWIPWDDGLATNGEDWGMFGTDLADVDNDGDLDIASISFGCCAGIHVYLNQGDGTWDQSFGFVGGNDQMEISFGDVNGDGNADVAASHQYGGVYLGDGTGNFAQSDGNLPPPGSGGRPGVSLGDLNDDGRADLAFCNSSGGPEVWTWTGPGTWQELSGNLPASGPCESTQLFDLDMDGHLDLAAFGNAQFRAWSYGGAGTWTEMASFTTPSPGYMKAFRVGGDADHNGRADIAIVDDEGAGYYYENHFRFFRESSTPSALAVKPVFPHGHEVLRAGSIVFVDWLSAVPGGEPGTVSVELSLYGPGGPWQPIATGLPNGGRYQWRIPPDTLATTDACLRYTLTTASGEATALTPAAFTILGGIEEPIAGLSAASNGPTALGLPTTLTATVTAGTNIAYTWSPGDGEHESGRIVTHTYPAAALYTATVTATNSLSLVTATVPVLVEEAIAGLAATSDSPTALGLPTTLTATISAGTHVAYAWSPGDGTQGSGRVITHTYPVAGLYSATVTAANAISALTTGVSIDVEEAPAGLSLVADDPTVLGRPTTLTATLAAGTNVTYTWCFGDQIVPAGLQYPEPAVVLHTYAAAGAYTAVVTAANLVGVLTATTGVTVVRPSSYVYLPIVIKETP